jgi:hypothetical protein
LEEGNVVADEENLDRRRARAPMNYYSENAYIDENIDDDDGADSVESADYSDDEQREQSGGSQEMEWRRDDIETIIALLSTFGYGRMPWDDFLKRAKLSKSHDQNEVRSQG